VAKKTYRRAGPHDQISMSSNLPVRFGRAVRLIRRSKGLTQAELAIRANFHRSYIASIEIGVRNASLETIAALSQALEVPITCLLDIERAREMVLVDLLFVERESRNGKSAITSCRDARLLNRVHLATSAEKGLKVLNAWAKMLPYRPRALIIVVDNSLASGPKSVLLRRAEALGADWKVHPVEVFDNSIGLGDARGVTRIERPITFLTVVDLAAQLGYELRLGFQEKGLGFCSVGNN
jgi:transcriptional regulator with XRE-family HTH domain